MSEAPENIQLTHADHVASGKTFPLYLLADSVEDPANIGSLFRLADALGVRHVYLAGASPTPPNAKLRRTARATEQYVEWSHVADPLLLVTEFKRRGVITLALELTRASIDIRQAQLSAFSEVLLIVGSENKGVSQPLLDEVAQTVHIPMLGRNSSMNVVTACAIAIFELTKNLSAN